MLDRNYSRLYRLLSGCLITLSLTVVVLAAVNFDRGMVFETDLQALFPQSQNSELMQISGDRLFSANGNRIILVFSAKDLKSAKSASLLTKSLIEQSSILKVRPFGRELELYSAQLNLLKKHRFHLLNKTQRIKLLKPGLILEEARTALFGLGGLGQVMSTVEDPLNLFNHYISHQMSTRGQIEAGNIIIREKDIAYVVVIATLNSDSFNLRLHGQLNHFFDKLENHLESQYSKVTLLKSGVVFHAAEASGRASKEVSIIATGSILGIILIFLWVFKTIRPLLFGLASIIFGSLSSLTFCQYYFQSIHLITLVFGASLIGVAIDYSLHYLSRCHNQKTLDTQNSLNTLKSVFPALFLGLTSTVLAYSCLMQAPLPGLSQIAMFSVIGLISAWLFVVVVYPYVFRGGFGRIPPVLTEIATLPWRTWQALGTKLSLGVITIISLISLTISFSYLKSSDSIRTLHRPSQQLVNNDLTVQKILQGYAPNQYFLVTAKDPQKLLHAEEVFLEKLDLLVNNQALTDYTAISQYLPSNKQQKINYQLLERTIYGANGTAYAFMRDLGFDNNTISQLHQEFQANEQNIMQPDSWLKSANENLELLWLGKIGQEYASIVALKGIMDVDQLNKAAMQYNNIFFVDKVADLTNIMQYQLESASVLLGIAYAIVLLLFIIYYRHVRAVSLILIPLISSFLSLALLAWMDTAITLFHVFGLYLILGLGLDYGIFIFQSTKKDIKCLVAIFLSAATSCLSFGLLAMSSTPMVSAFGLTILLGSVFNLCIAPAIRFMHPLRGSSL